MLRMICNVLLTGGCNILKALVMRSWSCVECLVCYSVASQAQDKCTTASNYLKVKANECWEGLKTTIHNAHPDYHEEQLVEVVGSPSPPALQV